MVAGRDSRRKRVRDSRTSDEQVAQIAKRLTGSSSTISSRNKGPANQISTEKIRSLGMQFGGQQLLESTIAEMLRDRKETSDTIGVPARIASLRDCG